MRLEHGQAAEAPRVAVSVAYDPVELVLHVELGCAALVLLRHRAGGELLRRSLCAGKHAIPVALAWDGAYMVDVRPVPVPAVRVML